MHRPVRGLIGLLLFFAAPILLSAEPLLLDEAMHHLRINGPREWTEFAEQADAERLRLKFTAKRNDITTTLRLRQQDVKQEWSVVLNEKRLGSLTRDENDMVVYFEVPTDTVVDGENVLLIEQDLRRQQTLDDIRVGQIQLDSQPKSSLLSESTLEVEIIDGDSNEHLPARITIVDLNGTLQTTGAASNDHLAVRPGIVYTSTGKAKIGLPAGTYRIYAGRGFEYSLDSTEVTLNAGQAESKTLKIRREVPTGGFVACDTHVHTLTHSGHGDATVDERMITLAAEGIELPIAADHNVHIDHDPFARKLNVRQHFTPVIGNEVTTSTGHFNVFPVRAGAKVPDSKLTDWNSILNDIYRTPDVKVAILNHARDLHSDVRPFGPKLFNAAVGENVRGWAIRFNAMEVITSGATQSKPLQLLQDWMALLNRGYQVTPVGSSDSHDVGRHFVGQGRTYVRCDDSDPGNIDVEQAVNNFVQGRVMVSYGLLAQIEVEGKYGPGELVPVTDDTVEVSVRVLGPHWVQPSHVALFANGQQIRQASLDRIELNSEKSTTSPTDLPTGVKWRGTWTLPKFEHDVHLVAIATGPGVEGVYWRMAKPYQPTSPEWESRMIGCSGAVWLDVDGDGRKTSAHEYAQRMLVASAGNLPSLVSALSTYDQAVIIQAAHLYQTSHGSLLTDDAKSALRNASETTQAGFRTYLHAWRETEIARASE